MSTIQRATSRGPAGLPGAGEGRTRGAVIVLAVSVLIGFLLTVFWSAPLVDRTIGDNIANNLLGHDAKATPVEGVLAGTFFAFVSGLAGTFTACNIAAFGAVAPLVGGRKSGVAGFRDTLRPLGWISVGQLAVSVVYGVIVALVGTRMPQFSTAATAPGTLSPRSIQSMVAFGVIGLAFVILGLVALGLLRDPMAPVTRRFPNAMLVLMGALIGGFLIGRPYPLFRIMFRDAAESGNVLYGAAAFALQSLGNTVVMALLFLLLTKGLRGRPQRWLAAVPGRAARVTGAALIVAGTFTILYWDLRVLSRIDLIWFPTVTWYTA